MDRLWHGETMTTYATCIINKEKHFEGLLMAESVKRLKEKAKRYRFTRYGLVFKVGNHCWGVKMK
jgi:hypothetical protein